MKKETVIVVSAGAAVGLAAIFLMLLGNPANMGFCIACFLRDIAGACGLHSAAKVQYVRPGDHRSGAGRVGDVSGYQRIPRAEPVPPPPCGSCWAALS